jgi:hypothetical protein
MSQAKPKPQVARNYVHLDFDRDPTCGNGFARAKLKSRHTSRAIRVTTEYNDHGRWRTMMADLEPGEREDLLCADTRIAGARFLS